MNQPKDQVTLVISTRNAHKVGEISAILGPSFKCISLAEFPGAPSVVEDANTFEGNATKKAVELAKWLAGSGAAATFGKSSNLYVLADDSGLEVDALDGAPGVNSARFAAKGPHSNSPDSENNSKLLLLLKQTPAEKRTARFRCVLALASLPDKVPASSSPVCMADEAELGVELFQGACEGRIGFAPQGIGGFGYDPLFIPDDMDRSFAELGEEVKNGISHRSRALAKLRKRLG